MNDEVKIYYTNETGVEMTNIDIKLKVSYTSGKQKKDLCDVVFTPEQAKVTALMLNQAIEIFENNNRKINIDKAGINMSNGEIKDGE